MLITPGRQLSKTLFIIDESPETVFSIAICRQSGDRWQSKNCFLAIEKLFLNRYKQCFRLPFVASRATDGNQKTVSSDF